MELFTLKLNKEVSIPAIPGVLVSRFEKVDVIDEFDSLIWTDRYYGDGDVEIVLPLSMDLIEKLPMDIFLGISESNELMIVDTVNIEDRKLKIQGISLLSWLNNRFIRQSKSHKAKSYVIDEAPGVLLWEMIYDAVGYAVLSSSNTDIHDDFLPMLEIPEIGIHQLDMTGDPRTVTVSFAPLYDELKRVAETYKIGMQLLLETNFDPTVEKPLGFRTYRGLNKTYTQDPHDPQNSIVRFSEDLESLTNVKEFQSNKLYRTIAFAFASGIDADVGDPTHGDHNAGIAYPVGTGEGTELSGFDCRAVQVFADNISGFSEPLSNLNIRKIIRQLSSAARKALADATVVKAIDGEVVVSTSMFQYGRDYNLGDLVEIQGSSGAIKIARVTEFIRVQDSTGERGYPTISVVETRNSVESPTVDELAPDPVNANDNAGSAIELPDDYGHMKSTNIDCTTDGMTIDGNSDWMLNEFGELTGDRNWHTMWYKWAVPLDRWVDGQSVFSAFLTDYDVHMVMLLLTPTLGFLPADGEPPGDPTMYQTLGGDSTGIDTEKPYPMLARSVIRNFWSEFPDSFENWIYIGIATPPIGTLNNKDEDHGGRFTLTWFFTP